MAKPRWFLIIVYFVMLAVPSLAADVKLRVAIGNTKHPYVSEETKTGIEYELITEPLKRAGYSLEVTHVSNKRALILLKEGKVDAAIDREGKIVSEPYIVYHNMAITFCDRKLEINSIEGLRKYKVGAFQNASKFLGEEFGKLALNKEKYSEYHPQDGLNSALTKDLLDVAISDINIFKYNQLEYDPKFKREICEHDIFEPTKYHLSFRDAKVRDQFNSELKKLREAKFYEALAKKYKQTYRRLEPYFKP